MAAIVMRCADGPAYVDSRVVTCAICLADCWLSKYSGDSTLALARLTGDPRIMCSPCFEVMLEEQERAT